MLTRVASDACTISDRDGRNEAIHDWSLSNLPDFRRQEPLMAQRYADYSSGLERNWFLDNQLRQLGRVQNNCNGYGMAVDAAVQAEASQPFQSICVTTALEPVYTKTTRVARNIDTYQSTRAKPMDWHFYTPAVPWPTEGVYQVNRWVDTQQAAKDQLDAANKQFLRKQYKGHC